MKKFFLIIFLSSLSLYAETLLKLYEALPNNTPSKNPSIEFCILDDYKQNGLNFSYTRYNPTTGVLVSSVVTVQWIHSKESGYFWNPSTKKCEITKPNPIEPEPTNPDNGDGGGSNPTKPIIPDENGLIMGMKETDFHFAMAIWGIALSFLVSIGFIISL